MQEENEAENKNLERHTETQEAQNFKEDSFEIAKMTYDMVRSVSSGDFAHLRIPGYFAHLLQHLKMKENDNSENSMIKNNPSLV